MSGPSQSCINLVRLSKYRSARSPAEEHSRNLAGAAGSRGAGNASGSKGGTTHFGSLLSAGGTSPTWGAASSAVLSIAETNGMNPGRWWWFRNSRQCLVPRQRRRPGRHLVLSSPAFVRDIIRQYPRIRCGGYLLTHLGLAVIFAGSVDWGLNSVVECYLHTVKVTGSSPVDPTICQAVLVISVLGFSSFGSRHFTVGALKNS